MFCDCSPPAQVLRCGYLGSSRPSLPGEAMRKNVRQIIVCCLAMAVVVGCRAPVLSITHVLPAAVPLDADVAALKVEPFTLREGRNEDLALFLAQVLQLRLAEYAERTGRDPVGPSATVGGEIHVVITNTETQRPIRLWDPAGRQATTQIAPSLVRQADVIVVFAIGREGSGAEPVQVEVRRSYDSRNDPAVWGPLGLARPDDPAGVPEANDIVHMLLIECADALVAMIQPLEVHVELPLRWTRGPDASAGLTAARRGEYTQAVEHFQWAAADRGESVKVLFDLAAVAEAGGQLDMALENYRKVAELTENEDRLAVEGAERVERIMRRLPAP